LTTHGLYAVNQWLKWAGTEFLGPKKSSPCIPEPQIYYDLAGTLAETVSAINLD